jgi:hypothetical protein
MCQRSILFNGEKAVGNIEMLKVAFRKQKMGEIKRFEVVCNFKNGVISVQASRCL